VANTGLHEAAKTTTTATSMPRRPAAGGGTRRLVDAVTVAGVNIGLWAR